MAAEPSAALELAQRMQAAAEHLSLPWRARQWRGQAGGWLGVGSGSSIDFQDHRPYLAGDDPRYIDWRAYARTGHYIMKLYREEVSPLLDLVLDASPSMAFRPEKRQRVLELFAFAAASARRSGGSLRIFTANAAAVRPIELEPALGEGDALFAGPHAGAPLLSRVPWRTGSMRVLISDLLFPGVPDALLHQLSAGRGRGIVFAPWCAAEAEPEWSGNLELEDCETGRRRVQAVDAALRAKFAASYRRHFALWQEEARRQQVAFARVASAPAFAEALHEEALPAGAVELC